MKVEFFASSAISVVSTTINKELLINVLPKKYSQPHITFKLFNVMCVT